MPLKDKCIKETMALVVELGCGAQKRDPPHACSTLEQPSSLASTLNSPDLRTEAPGFEGIAGVYAAGREPSSVPAHR